ncbi:hypothetical protein B0H16DRAFT_1459143 [Mycena metata]|uniref:Uncharacterized protein n=1 Tax=Mycena metata TaxID=1033252 RepID=A0AAD7NBR5_9AGAR|nr:hypothetical protein B0H16DRAFT_1459143 [Mycena metata]
MARRHLSTPWLEDVAIAIIKVWCLLRKLGPLSGSRIHSSTSRAAQGDESRQQKACGIQKKGSNEGDYTHTSIEGFYSPPLGPTACPNIESSLGYATVTHADSLLLSSSRCGRRLYESSRLFGLKLGMSKAGSGVEKREPGAGS